jgi:hypothetical protein
VSLSSEGDRVLRDGKRGKVLFGELDKSVVFDGTGTDETHSVGSVVFGNVAGEVISVDRVDVLLGAEDGVAEGLS